MCFSDLKKRSYYGRPFLALDSLPTERMALQYASDTTHGDTRAPIAKAVFPFSRSIILYLYPSLCKHFPIAKSAAPQE